MIGNYIKAVAVAVSRSTAKLMKTGQTTSYRTGDDGDIEAGRNVSFTVLAENNPFGNTNRFTDELGGQTYTKNIVIDWSTYDGSTVLGWRRTEHGSNVDWATAITTALSTSIAPFTTGWRLPNKNEINSIAITLETNPCLFYSPFNLFNTNSYWTGTTTNNSGSTGFAFVLNNNTGAINELGKGVTTRFLPCRVFTVTGTTLS